MIKNNIFFFNLYSLIAQLNIGIKRRSPIILKIVKSDFKYLESLSKQGYLNYKFIEKSIIFIKKNIKSYIYIIQVIFANYMITSGNSFAFKKILIVSRPVSKLFLNSIGYSKKNDKFSFIKPLKNELIFLSTSFGILPNYICKFYNIGGIILFKIF